MRRSCCRPRCRGAASRRGRTIAPRCADAPATASRLRDPRGRSNFGRSSRRGRSNFGRSRNGRSRVAGDLPRTREARTLIAAAILAGLVVTGLVEASPAIAGRRELRPAWSGEHASRFCHGLDSPRSGRDRGGSKILARTAIRRTAREFLVAAEFSLGTIAARTITIARRPRAVEGRSLPCGNLRRAACRVASRRRPLAAYRARLSPNFLSWKRPAGRASPRSPRACRGASRRHAAVRIIPIEPLRTIAKRPIAAGTRSVPVEAARRIVVVTARGCAFAFAGVRFAGTRIRFLVVGSGALGLAGIGAPFAVALVALALAGETALGELLLGSPRDAGTALAAGRPITPAAGIVVFVVIAGHE